MSGPMRFLTALAWMLAAWLVPVGSPAAAEIPIIVERLDATGVDTFEQVRAAPEAAWRAAPDGRLRRGQEPTWWRVRVRGPAAPAGEPLVLVLDDAFTAVVAAHVPPDHAPRVASRIDPDLRQPGSRHSLVFVVPGDLGDAHVHLELRAARAIPITPRLMAEEAHLARDLTRVRYSTAINVALLLFGLVAAIYAVALGRYAMLLLVAYCGLAAAYLLAISGELAALPGGAALMPESSDRRDREQPVDALRLRFLRAIPGTGPGPPARPRHHPLAAGRRPAAVRLVRGRSEPPSDRAP